MKEDCFPNLKQCLFLFLFYFIPPGLFLFLTLTVPQLFGFQLPVIYVNFNSIIAATIGLLPIIIYINNKSNLKLIWQIKPPNIITIILIILLAIAGVLLTSSLNNSKESFSNLIEGRVLMIDFHLTKFDLNRVILFIGTVFIVPVFEEIIFRKQILGLLLNKYSPSMSIIISSILFSSVHLRINDIGSLFIWGLLFGIAYHYTKSLEVSILLHSISNLSAFFIDHKYIEIKGMQILKYVLILLSCVAIVIFIIKYLVQKNSKLKLSDFNTLDN